MNGTKKAPPYSLHIHRYLSHNWLLILLCLSLLAGMALGALLIRDNTFSRIYGVENIVSDFYSQRSSQPFLKTLLVSFVSLIPLMTVSYFCGLFALGAPLSLLLILYRGLGIGAASGYLYAIHGLKGVAFSILLVLPGAFVSSLALILACRESFKFSGRLLGLFRGAAVHSSMARMWKLYTIKHLILLLMILLSATIDSIMALIFMRFFSF